MTYARRLLIAKLLITFGLLALVTFSVLAVQDFKHHQIKAMMNGGELYLTLTLCVIHIGLLLPLLYLLWGKLHGTGRGVRMAGYVGIIVAAAPMIAAHYSQKAWGVEGLHGGYVLTGNLMASAHVFVPMFLGLIISIKPKKSQ